MNTQEFMELIAPDGEHFFVVEIATSGITKHYHADTPSKMAKLALKKDSGSEANIYYSMASFKTASYEDSKGTTRRRTQDNVAQVKCFWVDLDCKGRNDGSDYSDKREALADIKRFRNAIGLVRPTAVVDSGNGLHAYWVLDRPIDRTTWEAGAARFEATLDAHGVRHDSSCTTDCARILRPVGTHNRKAGMDAKDVRLIASVGATLSLEEFLKPMLAGVAASLPGLSFSSSDSAGDMSLNEIGISASEFPPSSIKEIIKECALIKAYATIGGNIQEPIWHKTLGIVKHTIESEHAIHFFSKKHKDYTYEATVAKAEAWTAGPTTCDTLCKESSADLKTHCASCRHRGTITSPIQLGHKKIMMVETTHVMESGTLTEVAVEVPALPVSMSWKYQFEKEKLLVKVLDKDATKQDGQDRFATVPFCDFYFYPFSYYDDELLRHRMVWKLREREGVYREFVLSGGAMGAGGQALFKELGEQGVVPMPGGKTHMEAYIANFMTDVKKRAPSTTTYTHFGWNNDDFLIGDTLIAPSGEHKKARLGGGAASLANKGYFKHKGSVARWKELIDKAYGYPNQEQYQFVLCTGFGSPLIHLMGQRGGAVVSAVSPESGHGKSTAGMLATGIYGSGKSGDLTLTREQATDKAVFAMAGVLHSLPVMVDEMTNVTPIAASNIIYTFSQGSGRITLYNDGSLNLGRHDWSAIMNISSNKHMGGLILSVKPGADAELARMIEFECENVSNLNKAEADLIFEELFNNHTLVGIEYMTWVQQHIDEVRDLLKKVQVMLDKRLRLEKRDRFWSYAIAADITGAMIAKKIGLITFDVGGIIRWLERRVLDMRAEAKTMISSSTQLFSSMLTEISPGLIVTDIEGDKRSKSPVYPHIVREPRAPYTGRVVIDSRRAYIIQPVMQKWCVDNQVNVRQLLVDMVREGWVLNNGESMLKFPAKGTDITMGQFRCYVLDLDKMEAAAESHSSLSNIVSIFEKGVAR